MTRALIGTLGMLAGATLAQPAPGDHNNPPPPPDRPGGGRPDPEMRRKMLLEKYDGNKDGRLDDTELALIGKALLDGKFGPPPGQHRRGPDGQGGPRFGAGPRGQGPGADPARQWDSRDRGPRPPGPGGFDGDGPPMARRPSGQEFDGARPPGPPGFRQPAFGQRDGQDDGRPPRERAPMADREGGSDRGQIAPRPDRSGGPSGEQRRNLIETQRRELIKKYDADGDGKLSGSEREAIGRDIEDGKLPPPPFAPQAPREPQPRREPRQPRPSE